jgi:predicted DCC family thiol-disulfide oxidoreductase YuxK
MITVFYDGKCGLCSKEINHYKTVASKGIFDWQDVTISTEKLDAHNITLVDALKFLHALDANNKQHVGVDAFILIWKQLKRWHILAYIVALPIIRQIAQYLYKAFAKWRFKKLDHCQVALNNDQRE